MNRQVHKYENYMINSDFIGKRSNKLFRGLISQRINIAYNITRERYFLYDVIFGIDLITILDQSC